ncbi:nuclear transport factor 2 family protein [Mycobacterium sp. Marseille-P9652]|uniref:nuclear transport factor 2 family protein n=1 Tax=Mycobacterium sp. Marseille-P9652 TaxID=2654950 RepID=UPI001E473D6B|nr:nuclear transport factor 2 family protein [Mycobacterium sp. Marseille-P9652]
MAVDREPDRDGIRSDVGGVDFDVADRLAIINLFGAYAHTYDENRLDEFRALFTESPELVLLHDGAPLSGDIDTVMSLLAARKAAFKAENNQRRHALDSFWIAGQTADEATGHCYVQVFAVKDGGPPTPDLTGRYEFTAVKQHGSWRFHRWVVVIDQTQA